MLRKRKIIVFSGAISVVMLLYFYVSPDDALIKYSSGARIRDTDYLNLADAYFRVAVNARNPKAQRDKLLQKAAANLRESIEVNPVNLKAYLFLGDVYHKLGQYAEEKQVYNRMQILARKNKAAKGQIVNMDLYDKTPH